MDFRVGKGVGVMTEKTTYPKFLFLLGFQPLNFGDIQMTYFT